MCEFPNLQLFLSLKTLLLQELSVEKRCPKFLLSVLKSKHFFLLLLIRFTFYDGPPFATGLPHYGHILAGTIKDIVTRYAHQSGFHVDRRFGWDCHGLPVVCLSHYPDFLVSIRFHYIIC